MTVVAAALLGLLASGHCLAMCGPLVLALGTGPRTRPYPAQLAHAVTYHAGRVSTYMLLGLVAGLAGGLVTLAGLGRALAIGGGLLLVAAGVAPAVVRWRQSWTGPWMGLAARAASAARRWQAHHPVAGPFAAGMANGLLPCGMVYAALAAALAAGSVEGAVWTMAAFGAGTSPALAGLSLTATRVSPGWRRRLSRAAPAGLVLVGVLLLARGVAPPAHAAHPGPAPPAHSHP